MKKIILGLILICIPFLVNAKNDYEVTDKKKNKFA